MEIIFILYKTNYNVLQQPTLTVHEAVESATTPSFFAVT